MNRESVQKLVQRYVARNHLSKAEFARQIGISDQTVQRLLNSQGNISTTTLNKMATQCAPYRFAVVGFNSGKVYFRGRYHADCTRWINEQVRTGETLHSSRKTYLDIDEPMLIQHLPEAS